MVLLIAVGIGTDMTIKQECFPTLDVCITVFEIQTSFPDGFDLRPTEDDSRFELFDYEIIMESLFICCYQLLV
jgi:hypothetical protein